MSHLWEFSKDLSSRTGVCHDCSDIMGAGIIRKILYAAFIAKAAFCIILWNVKNLCRRNMFNGTFENSPYFILGVQLHVPILYLPPVRASSQLFLRRVVLICALIVLSMDVMYTYYLPHFLIFLPPSKPPKPVLFQDLWLLVLFCDTFNLSRALLCDHWIGSVLCFIVGSPVVIKLKAMTVSSLNPLLANSPSVKGRAPAPLIHLCLTVGGFIIV